MAQGKKAGKKLSAGAKIAITLSNGKKPGRRR